MTDEITIREYTEADKNEVINLIRSNTPKFFAVEEEEDFKDYLESEIELYYVLLFNHKIVGCGGINFFENKSVAKISWDIFHPDFQGKSLGSMLMKYRLGILDCNTSIQKVVVRTSQIAYKFYEKQGFKLILIKRDYWSIGYDLYYMEFKRTMPHLY